VKEINEVDWQALGAPEVPRWLHDLQLEEGKSRIFSESYNDLWQFLVPENASFEIKIGLMSSEVHHQVVPYLIDIMENESNPTKVGSMLDMLELLARRWFLVREMRDNDPDKISYAQWARRVNDAVRAGIPVYQRLLDFPGIQGEMAAGLLDVLEKTQT
jgi:hypothetical protein